LQLVFNKGAGTCNKLCTKSYDPSKPDDLAKLTFIKKGMSMNYQHHWIVDNMPVRFYFVKFTFKY
jgi:transmembrane 9 superfamily protein 2/4